MATVEDTPVAIAQTAGLIQNLGPGALYVGDSEVTDETGIKIGAGMSVTVDYPSASAPHYVVSESTSDVRFLVRGVSISAAEIAPAE